MSQYLLKQANQFLKVASKQQLENLLKSAFMGDRDSWLVFLDLLEEERPQERKILDLYKDDITRIFSILSDNFPSLIDEDKKYLIFKVPNFGDIQKISKYKLEFYYEGFHISRSFSDNLDVTIDDTSIQPSFNDNKVWFIAKLIDGSLSIIYSGALGNTRDFVGAEHPDYSNLKLFLDNCFNKRNEDLSKLKHIFAIPSKQGYLD